MKIEKSGPGAALPLRWCRAGGRAVAAAQGCVRPLPPGRRRGDCDPATPCCPGTQGHPNGPGLRCPLLYRCPFTQVTRPTSLLLPKSFPAFSSWVTSPSGLLLPELRQGCSADPPRRDVRAGAALGVCGPNLPLRTHHASQAGPACSAAPRPACLGAQGLP